ncbi:MAG: uracil phosphoribosyltransferase [Spirochaetales bacterium]|nr:uracil phosphoribosyltransferase [Spirochaetales bacterium]
MKNIVLTATDLDGYLTEKDHQNLKEMDTLYQEAVDVFKVLETTDFTEKQEASRKVLIKLYEKMGAKIQEITGQESAIKVYPFDTPQENHGEASRLIAKLRNLSTEHHEFVYYIQRAYEMLFNLAFTGSEKTRKNYFVTKTPVNIPVQNYAVHKIPDVDEQIENSVMCVMLRGALLPSMIMSKEVQEYSSKGYITPFALFRIKRDDTKKEKNMEYILDLDKSFFDLESLNGKDLIFADPMNATGGSLVTIMKYLGEQGVKPKSVKFFNVISALKGSLRIIRAIPNATVYTLWMDPALNELAYILPGLGDAGDRLNGEDVEEYPRNIIQLIADYGSNLAELYRAQVREIEETVLG